MRWLKWTEGAHGKMDVARQACCRSTIEKADWRSRQVHFGFTTAVFTCDPTFPTGHCVNTLQSTMAAHDAVCIILAPLRNLANTDRSSIDSSASQC